MYLDMVSENVKTTNNYLIVMGTFFTLSGADHIRGTEPFGNIWNLAAAIASKTHEHAALAIMVGPRDTAGAHNGGWRHYRAQSRRARTRGGSSHHDPCRSGGIRRHEPGQHPAAGHRQDSGVVRCDGFDAAPARHPDWCGLHRWRRDSEKGRSCHRRHHSCDVVGDDRDRALPWWRSVDPRLGRNGAGRHHTLGLE